MRNKQGSLEDCQDMPRHASGLFTALCLTKYTRTDSVVTIQPPHKRDEETGLGQGYQPLRLQCAKAAERSGHKGWRNVMLLFSSISDYTQWQLTEVT